jgi:hypothetical protein
MHHCDNPLIRVTQRWQLPRRRVACLDTEQFLRGVLVNEEMKGSLGAGLERHALRNGLAEQIAASADRLERQAADVRASDKQLALQLMKEATRLRRVARGIDIQHKRAQRARMRRLELRPQSSVGLPAPDKSKAAWIAFLADPDGDAARVG